MLPKAAVCGSQGRYLCVPVPAEQKKKTKPKQLIPPATNKEKEKKKRRKLRGKEDILKKGRKIIFKM